MIDVDGNKVTILTTSYAGAESEQTIAVDGDTFTTTMDRRQVTFVRAR